MKPSLLATGLSGMVGSRFQRLYGDRYDLVNLDLSTGVDITDPDTVSDIFERSNAGSVIHLAAFTNVSAAHEQNGDTEGVCYKVNVHGTRTIAKAAADTGKYLIHISTDYIFDGTKEEPYTETDTPHPIEWYGETKWLAEQEVRNANGKHVILRLAFPYQAQPSRPDFLAKIVENLKNNTLPPAFADHTITPTFVDDVCQVFDYCIRQQPIGVYHMVGSSSLTDYDIATMVKEIFQLPGEVKAGSLAKYLETVNRPYQRTMRVSNQKLRREFGIQMKTLQEGLNIIKTQP